MLDLNNPFVQSALLPFAISFVAAGLLRWLGGPGRGARLAGTSVGIAFGAAYLAIQGAPLLPPVSAVHKLAVWIGCGIVCALLLDGSGRSRGVVAGVGLAWVLLGTAWLAEPRLRAGSWVEPLVACALAGFVLLRLATRPPGDGIASVLVLATSIGLSGVALLGASASLAQSGGAVAAAAGGFLVWNWPRQRFPYAAGALLGGGGALALLGAQLLLYSEANRVALAILLLALYADDFASRLPLGSLGRQAWLRPVVVASGAALPALAAIGWASW